MKIGWIGTGVMGNSMCQHLLKKFPSLYVYTRTQAKLQNLLDLGCVYKTPLEMAKECDVIITMLGYPKDVEEVLLDDKTGLIYQVKSNTIIIDHTTSSPILAKRIAEAGIEKGVEVIDAPVSGGDVGAKNGTLIVMCGGSQVGFDRAKEFIGTYAKDCKLFGQPGMGQHAKMANQISVASTIIAVSETILYAENVGLDSAMLIDLIKNGAAASFSLEKYGPRILDGNFDPGFYVEHFVKDIEICLDECRKMNLTLPGLTNAHMLYKMYIAQGGAKKGAHGLIECLRFINNQKK
jgi:3-hydroxyisobutyrate dehydrogenase